MFKERTDRQKQQTETVKQNNPTKKETLQEKGGERRQLRRQLKRETDKETNKQKRDKQKIHANRRYRRIKENI